MNLLGELFSSGVWGTEPPEIPDWVKWTHRSKGKTHCPICLKLDGNWFLSGKTPMWPHHPNCHCILDPVDYIRLEKEAKAYSPYSKFDPYLFDLENYYKHTKGKLFQSWGYTISDSNWLKKEFEKQSLKKYIDGEYTLGKLNEDDQRISIRIEIPRKNKEGIAPFITGWMVYPDGYIQLTTPYGGK